MPLSTLRYLLGLAGVFLRFRLHHLIPAQQLPSRMARALLALLRRVLPARQDMPAQLATALTSRGPVYIKLGQLLSTRPDVFGHAICRGLAQLQDRVPPFAEQDAMAIIHQALGEQALAAFEHIESQPIASASIAQVHAARLITGEGVVIKVLDLVLKDKSAAKWAR